MSSIMPDRRTSSARRLAWSAWVIGLVVSGCGSPTPSYPEAAGPTATATRDGVMVSLSLEHATLTAGERSMAIVTVENTSPERRLWQGGGCDFVADIRIEVAAPVSPAPGMSWPGIAGRFKELLLPGSDAGRRGSFVDVRFADPTHIACTLDLRTNSLSSGQVLEMHAIWNGEVNGAVAAPGPATVVASFPYLGRVPGPDMQPQPIEASVAVDVADGGIHLLSPGEAIDAALGYAPFAAFLAEAGEMRTWNGIDLEASGHLYVVVLTAASEQGRASVDRETGAVSFERKPGP